MKFLVDANLPPGLATWLREQAHEAIHVSDQPGLNLDDRAVFEFARQHGYIIMTKDGLCGARHTRRSAGIGGLVAIGQSYEFLAQELVGTAFA